MQLLKEEDREAYKDFMESVACTLVRESMKNIEDLAERHSSEEIEDSALDIHQAAGQVVYDDVIEMTKDMSKEEVVKYLTEASMQLMMSMMNNNPMYRLKMELMSELKK